MLILASCAGAVTAQHDIQSAFDKASALNDRHEYLKAAKAFQHVQEMALQAGDINTYINSTTAAGECFYMLNTAIQIKTELDKAQAAYTQHQSKASKLTRLTWAEAISKLEGSYESLLCENDPFHSPNKARKAFNRCLQILDTLDSIPGYDDPEAPIVIHRELVNLHYLLRDFQSAYKEMKFVFKYYNNTEGYVSHPRSDEDRRKNSGFMDAYRSMAMVLARLKNFERAEATIDEAISYCGKDPSLLRTKGKILMLHSDVDGLDRRGEAMGLYDQYLQSQKKQLNAQMDEMTDVQREQYWLNFHNFLFDCCRLEDQAPEMLYDLALFSKGYLLEYQKKKTKSYTWKDIRNKLDAHSCAIEFVQYNGKNDRKQLAALVVTPHCSKPTFVHIADLDSLLGQHCERYTLNYAITAQTNTNVEKDKLYEDPALPALVWTADLMKAMDGATHIYFAADGLLHQLAIEYLLPDTAYQCHRLTSTRLLVKGHKPLDTRKMLLFGGIDYGFPISPSEEGNDEQAYIFLKSEGVSISNLAGTQREIDSVAALRHSEEDLILSGNEATDSAFRATASLYPIVLISTHGFFLGETLKDNDLRPTVSDNSLSNSGLAFAGSRFSLNDTTYDKSRPDGILSAKELSTLTLDSTDLIVLSACQTGLGTITADGVYGVQRALKKAGVRAMIVSLWSVDDGATAILMRNFFRNLNNAGKDPDVYEAFMNARKQLISSEHPVFDAGSLSSKKKAKYAAPRFSNAFILIDVL